MRGVAGKAYGGIEGRTCDVQPHDARHRRSRSGAKLLCAGDGGARHHAALRDARHGGVRRAGRPQAPSSSAPSTAGRRRAATGPTLPSSPLPAPRSTPSTPRRLRAAARTRARRGCGRTITPIIYAAYVRDPDGNKLQAVCPFEQRLTPRAPFPRSRLHAKRPLRLAVQDAALSRLKHGFDSRRGHQDAFQGIPECAVNGCFLRVFVV